MPTLARAPIESDSVLVEIEPQHRLRVFLVAEPARFQDWFDEPTATKQLVVLCGKR